MAQHRSDPRRVAGWRQERQLPVRHYWLWKSTGSTFQITASPSEAGKRAFCIDQSGALEYAADGQAATCLAVGQPLHMSSNVSFREAPVVVTPPAQGH